MIDLYGTPLYQPAERHFESGQSLGVLAAAAVIKATGGDPNFISDRTVIPPLGPRSYEIEHRPPQNRGWYDMCVMERIAVPSGQPGLGSLRRLN